MNSILYDPHSKETRNKEILKQFKDINTRLDSIEKTGKEEGGSDGTSEP